MSYQQMRPGQAAAYNGQQQPAGIVHLEYLDLKNDGTVVECIILKRHANGDRVFIRIDHLDEIDKKRFRELLSDPHSSRYELWDLLSVKRLGNGMNALEYFHQLAMHYIARTKTVILPNAAVVGAAAGRGQGGQVVGLK